MKSAAFLSLASLALGAVDCQNGNICPDNTQCISTKQGAGRKWGCTSVMAGNDAVRCGDFRFSCPSQHTCDVWKGKCVDQEGLEHPILHNGNAERSPVALALDAAMGVEPNGVVCTTVAGDLPSECTCSDSQGGLAGIVQCSIDVLGEETITVKANIEPCHSPMEVQFEVSESALGIDWHYTLDAGINKEIAIPGLSISIPGIASAGINAVLALDGNVDDLDVQLGIDVCGSVIIIGEECGSDISDALPIWILDEEFNFGSVCGSKGVKPFNNMATITNIDVAKKITSTAAVEMAEF